MKTQNAPFLLRVCIANRRHGAAAWTFVRQHWDEANDRVPAQHDRAHGRPVKPLDRPSSVVADVQALLRRAPDPAGAPRRSTRSLERQRVNAALRERERVDLAAAL